MRGLLPTLVALPLALAAGAWAINAVHNPSIAPPTGKGPAPAAKSQPPVVPPVPDSAYDDPAHAPGRSGELGLGVANQPVETVVADLKRSGIPNSALRAYALAQAAMVQADKACHLPWTLVAAIGRVESNHGRIDGSVLTRQGKAVPALVGPALDGRPGLPHVADSDDGVVDKDKTFDRGVGPMQFLPSTWASVGVDADRDSTQDAQDVDDATLSSAVYLCSGSDDLATPSGLRSAMRRYNDSEDYFRMVVAVKGAYEAGQWTQVADGRQLPGTPSSPDPSVPDPEPTSEQGPGPDSPDPGQPDPEPRPSTDASVPPPAPDPIPSTKAPSTPGPTPPKMPSPKPQPEPPSPSPTPTSDDDDDDDDDGGLPLPLPLPPLPIPLPDLLTPV